MTIEKSNFDKCIEACQEINAVYSYLKSNGVAALNKDSILRAEYVLLVSAFDYYIHQIVCNCLVKKFFTSTITCDEELISLPTIQQIEQVSDQAVKEQILFAALQKRFSKDSFQSPRSIEYALGLLGISRIWATVSPGMRSDANSVKNTLALIVNRRNQIAHEADIEVPTGIYRAISQTTVDDCRVFLSNLVINIDRLL